ncbi:MAG: potassium/proton antiporter [Snowella sp.]|nr:potassium/proton antiporter [Snowella sp.]
MFPTEQIFIIIAVLLLASVFASKASARFGVPALLLFLIVGMVAGSDGIGQIQFHDPVIAKFIGDFALTIILFTGGLDTEWSKIRPVLLPGLTLASVGVILTVLLVATFSWFILGSFSSFEIGTQGISWGQALLLGAIISSTDAAAVFSVFRSSTFKLPERLQGLLELESGSNDPIAVLLTINILATLTRSHFSVGAFLWELFLQLAIAILIGYGSGLGMVWMMNHLNLPSQGLYPVATLGGIFLISGTTPLLNGSAVLAVYLAGIIMGNRPFVHKESIVSFHDGLTWLMQITMFLTFGLLVNPSELPKTAGVAIAIALFLIFVARPVSVFVSLGFDAMKWQEKLFISWVGLRGSVPIILATLPLTVNFPHSKDIFNVVFFIVLVSIFLQGLTLVPVAKYLKLAEMDEVNAK